MFLDSGKCFVPMSHGNNRPLLCCCSTLFPAVQFSFYIQEFEAFIVIIIVIFLPIARNHWQKRGYYFLFIVRFGYRLFSRFSVTRDLRDGSQNKAGTKVGPDQFGPLVRVGSTRIE